MIRKLPALADSVGVQTKIMGIVVGLILLLGLGATLELRQRNADALGHELDGRAISIARDLAARSSDLILTNNTFGLYELARDSTRLMRPLIPASPRPAKKSRRIRK